MLSFAVLNMPFALHALLKGLPFVPVGDPEFEVLARVEEVVAESIISDEGNVALLVESSAPEILKPKNHRDAQVFDGSDDILVGQQRPPHTRRVLFVDFARQLWTRKVRVVHRKESNEYDKPFR